MNPIDYNFPTKWLLCCLKLNKSTEDINTLKNLSDNDWDAILQLAIHHGVAPCLYQQHHYPLRWKNLLQRYGQILWNLLQRDLRTTARFKEEEKGNALIKWFTS